MSPDVFPGPTLTVWAGSVWQNLFALGPSVAEKMIRPVLVYVALVVGLRVFGKRELAQLNPFDFVVLISLANTVQNAIIGADDSVTGGLIGAFTLLSVNYLVVRFLFGHRRLDQWVEGRPAVLVKDGRVLRKALAKELITESELMMVLHRQGFARLDEIARVDLEPGGTFTVTGKEPRLADRHHAELVARLDALTAEVTALKERVSAG